MITSNKSVREKHLLIDLGTVREAYRAKRSRFLALSGPKI